MKALWLRMAMCVPMYLFEHHLACDLVDFTEQFPDKIIINVVMKLRELCEV